MCSSDLIIQEPEEQAVAKALRTAVTPLSRVSSPLLTIYVSVRKQSLRIVANFSCDGRQEYQLEWSIDRESNVTERLDFVRFIRDTPDPHAPLSKQGPFESIQPTTHNGMFPPSVNCREHYPQFDKTLIEFRYLNFPQ